MDKAQQVGVEIEAKDPLEKKLDSIQTIYNEERERAKRQKLTFDRIYSFLDNAVDEVKAPAGKAPSRRPSRTKPNCRRKPLATPVGASASRASGFTKAVRARGPVLENRSASGSH